jgi:hypothetical protein
MIMNKIIKLTVFSLLAAFMFSACNKQVSKIYFEGGTAPVLTLTQVSNLEYANADKTAFVLNWTNPNYQLTTGVSSQDVSYKIQMDTAGSNFSHPYEITVSKELSYSFTVSQFNDILQNQMNLLPAMQHTIEIKVIASMANNAVPLPSDSIQYLATPYVIPPKITPPASGELYITGSATDGGWMVGNGVGVPVPTQQFTKVDDLHFTITVHLNGGQEYLFLPVNGDWGHKYACKKKADQPKSGGDFGLDLSDNFPAPDASGTYKIDVDFQKGKYTVTLQ